MGAEQVIRIITRSLWAFSIRGRYAMETPLSSIKMSKIVCSLGEISHCQQVPLHIVIFNTPVKSINAVACDFSVVRVNALQAVFISRGDARDARDIAERFDYRCLDKIRVYTLLCV